MRCWAGAGAGNVEPGLLCSKPAVAVNYMHAPKWSDQAATLEQYWPSASTEGRLPVVVLSVGFWEKSAEVPEVRDPLHCCMFFTYLQPLSLYFRRLWVLQSHRNPLLYSYIRRLQMVRVLRSCHSSRRVREPEPLLKIPLDAACTLKHLHAPLSRHRAPGLPRRQLS